MSGHTEGRPFSAKAEWTASWARWPVIRLRRWRGFVARDGAGRFYLRVDGLFGRPLMASIADIVGRRFYGLDVRRRTYLESECGGPMVSPTELPDGLPRREIEGLDCGEFAIGSCRTWVSAQLMYPVQETAIEGRLRYTWRMSEIVQAEPDATLFVVPPGWSRVE